MTSSAAFENIADKLVAFRAPDVFNPWRDIDPLDVDGAAAPSMRLERLRRHFNAPATALLIGEAPGYQGCHFSGIAFTSEALLCEGAIPRIGRCERITTRERPWREPSATIVWRSLYEHGLAETVVMWNAFAFHPHIPSEPYTNRAPTWRELELAEPILLSVLSHFVGVRVVAIGNVAASALARLGVTVDAKVRHPSMGGAPEFLAGIARLT